jgi:hypothetical protein
MFCGGVARRLDRSSHLHRLRHVAVERRCSSPGCQQRVAGDLAGGVGHRSDTKRRLERLGDPPGRRVCRQFRQPPRKRPRNGGPGSVQACDIGMRVAAFESRGARTEYIGCRRHRLCVLVSGELDHGSFGRRRQKGEEPVQLVWSDASAAVGPVGPVGRCWLPRALRPRASTASRARGARSSISSRSASRRFATARKACAASREPAASQAFREQRVPRVMYNAPIQPSPRYASRRARVEPPNSTNRRNANEPNAAKIDVCGCWMTLSANANTAGMTIAARPALFSAARSGTAGDDMPG